MPNADIFHLPEEAKDIEEADITWRLLEAHQSGYRTWLPTTYLEEGKRWI